MSDAYLISPLDEDIYCKVEPENLAEKLKTHWPQCEAVFNTTPESSYVLHWRIRPGQYSLLGGLQANCQIVSVEGDLAEVADFARWYRAIVPSECRLFIYHTSINRKPFPLSDETTSPEIMLAFREE